MKTISYTLVILTFIFFAIISCSSFEDEEYAEWEKFGNPEAWFTSNAVADATIAFGNGYRHQVSTGGYDNSANMTVRLANQPSGMVISSTGLVVWTPTKASQIKKHPDITIFIELPSGYVISQTYDLTVTGECTTGNVLAIWSGDQRYSTDSYQILGNVTSYTDNSSNEDVCGSGNNADCTASNNYDYNTVNGASENLHIGPSPSATKGNMFFYNQYDNADDIYLFWMFGVGGSSSANKVHIDVYTSNNTSSDDEVVSDDAPETNRESQTESNGLYSSTYTGRYKYDACCSDGGVLGPFSGSTYRLFVDITGKSSLTSSHITTSAEDLAASGTSGYDLGLGNLNSFTFWSRDGSSFSLGDTDNFTIGYASSFDCNN